MSQAMFDKESWNRALGPAIRVVGYFSAIFLVLFLLFVLLDLLTNVFGFPEFIILLFSTIGPFLLVFVFILSIFKVLDEELARNA